jgi:diguanylate cyclase (GGDEF)-like protein/PAS domain S-box-containing protein
MSPLNARAYGSDEEEIAALLNVLRETGQRLEDLTSGGVDLATDPEGRVLLLRGTREQLKQSEITRQAAILNALPDRVALLDSDGTIISVNDGWTRFATANTFCGDSKLGLRANYLAICDCMTGPGAEDAHIAADGIRSVLSGSIQSFSFDYEGDASSSSFEERWFQLTVTSLSADRPKGVIVKHCNISASKRDKSDIASLAQRLSLAAEVAKVGVWEWDVASDTHTWDATMMAIYGFRATDPVNYQKWSSTVHPDDLPEVEVKLQRAIKERKDQAADFRITTADGTRRFVSSAHRAVVDATDTVCRVIGVNVDVTDRKLAEQELCRNQANMTHLAEHDFLTGLPNQMALRDRIEQAIKMAARNHTNIAVMFLDLDGFKHINDSLGHSVGDELLKSTAQRLAEVVRNSDTLSRFGGDEFIVLLPEVLHPEATTVAARRMLDAMTAIHILGQNELQVSACIGISVYPEDGEDADALIKSADIAMYQAKAKGGSTFQFFHPDMNIRAVERQFVEQSLRWALKRKELALHYQPKVDLKSRTVTGVEALIRWTHPVRGAISPTTFIPVAEDSGLILPIGIWVLEEACRQVREWLDSGLPRINVAVNVSGRQFQSENFEEKVMAVLEEFGIDPRCLELEVTESLLMKAPEFTAKLLQSLRAKGIRVAIDDFGTGYSSLSYLRRFPIDTLKIDQSFIRQIDTPDGVSMVKAIIDLGRNLSMQLVAEGVETELEATILEGLGCDRAQGYYFSRPLTPAQLGLLLKKRASTE